MQPRSIIAAGLILFALCSPAWAPMGHGIYPAPPAQNSGGVAFTPLHLYYMSPTGSDSANGLTPATAWASPNHTVSCGDVIIAAAGNYTTGFASWGTVNGCPSASGGIDGAGGIYFATILCAGPDLVSCNTTNTSGNNHFDVQASNWAVEGFQSLPGGGVRSFEPRGCTSTVLHHIAFINDIAINSLQAAGMNDCGVQTNGSADYYAVVGFLAQNAAADPICLAAIDFVGPGVLDANAGTHYYAYGDFSYSNTNVHCQTVSDTEGFMADTLDFHHVRTTVVFANNIGFNSDRECIHLFEQTNDPTGNPPVKVYNNTCYDDSTNIGSNFTGGEIDTNSTLSGGMTWLASVWNNIAYQPRATSAAGNTLWSWQAGVGVTAGGTQNVGNVVGTGDENVLKGSSATCPSSCDSGRNAISFAGATFLGGNTYTNPLFSNLTDLTNNRLGAPNCAGFQTTTQCMGYNPTTSTLTPNTVIADLQATCAGCAGKGYQLPSTTCAANSDYPTWLKGVVRLQWNSSNSTITEMPDLVTKPCGT